ncbi:uncharacterized protein LOC144864907 [Branchiostoma floridae x Branchiostoma japonicum]
MAAASTRLSLGTQIREELSCSICLELFTRPKVLPCQHTFCLSPCLENLAGRGGALKCAICRQQVRLPPQGVAGLPDNHLVTSLCERLQNQATLSGETREQPQSGNRCSFHPSEVLELYCKHCHIAICKQCLEDAHDGHLTTTAKKAAQERSLTVQTLINEGRNIQEKGHHHGNQRQGRHQPKNLVITFGGKGSGTGQLDYPYGVTVSDEGEIFVASRWNNEIQVFTLQGTFVRQFPTATSGGLKMGPEDVAMDGEGNLWVVGMTDYGQVPLQYNKQGSVLGTFDLKLSRWVRGVAVDTRRNHILITQTAGDKDDKHGEVLVFRPDGTLVRTVGQQQGMKHPWYITVDVEGNILVSDYDGHCVYMYNEDGQFLFQFGGEGSGEGQLKGPRGICTDRAGNIIVTDWGNRRVEMFDKTGKFLKHINIATDVKVPQAVAMATQGQLVVTDYEKHTVSIFQNF